MSRFDDNTTSRPVDRVRRYGYAPGFQYMSISTGGSNIPGNYLPQGELLLFLPRVESFKNENFKKEQLELSAQYFANNVSAAFQTGEKDFGYRTLDVLTGLEYDPKTDYDEADKYWAVIQPRLTKDCEMGLETTKNTPCPTCRLKWLESEECSAAITMAVDSGLNREVFNSLRMTLIDSNRVALTAATSTYDKVKGEVESPHGKGAFDDADYQIMKLIHKKAQYIEQAELVQKNAEIQGAAIAKGIAGAMRAEREESELEIVKRELAEAKAKLESIQSDESAVPRKLTPAESLERAREAKRLAKFESEQ